MQAALRRCGAALACRDACAESLLLPSLLLRAGLATHGVAGPGETRESGVPRFYETVNVREAFEQGGYQVFLDHRVLRTPARQPVVLPTRALATAVAAEWEMQARRIQPYTMPLMSLAATAIDQPVHRGEVITAMLQYLHTDSVLCRDEAGSSLADLQAEIYDPVLEWARAELGVALQTTDSIFGAEVPEQQLEVVADYLHGLDRWRLVVAEQLASASKSVLLGLAGLGGQLSLEGLLRAARLEEDHQLQFWGLVEGGHDIDIADTRVRIAAPHLFARLLTSG